MVAFMGMFWTLLTVYTDFGFDPKYMEGKRVIVTGASQGIGEEIAYELSRMKSKVVLVARSKDKLERIVKKCLQLGAQEAYYISFDMSNREDSQFEKLIDDSAKLLNSKSNSSSPSQSTGLDMVILNHLTSGTEILFDSWPDTFKARGLNWLVDQYYTNTFSYFALSNFAIPYLEPTRGHLVVVSSASGFIGIPKAVAYSSEKHALNGYFNALRNNLAVQKRFNMSVTVCPLGAIATEEFTANAKKAIIKAEPVDDCARRIIIGGARREHTMYYPYHVLRPVHFISGAFPKLLDFAAQNSL
jgi:short-subunit dehydrogenase